MKNDMPTKYPKGSYIVRDGERRKVLEELGELRFLSWDHQQGLNWETMASVTLQTAIELEHDGWKVEEAEKASEPWRPMEGETYFFTDTFGRVCSWGFGSAGMHCPMRLRVGNCYRTREEAEKAAERVRKAYRG